VTALWTQAELSAALGVAPSSPPNTAVTGVSIDSRTLAAGDLFFAIRGDAHDGHDHVARAFEAGSAAVVVSRERAPQLAALGPAFAVEDTLRAMERLGVAARARSKAKIVAVTGSVGKTTAKEMLRTMLTACGATHASAASYNNHWGVPLTLARMPANARFGVFEMGMNHAGEITPLTRMARPHVTFVTTIAPVHIEHLGSLEAIADAKAEIFLGLEPRGTAVLNRDAPQFERLAKAATARGARVRSFGDGADCDAQLLEVEATDGGSQVRARVLAHELAFELGAPGVHMAQDALGALLTAEALGADVQACAAALRQFSPQKGRGERFLLPTADGPATIIDESYNANPASMRAALALLAAAKPGPKGRRIAVIGDMLELGPKAAAMHAAGPLTRALYEAAPPSMRAAWTERSSELTDEVARTLRGGDVAMIKGSNGSRMGPLVSALRDRLAHGAGG
jgi:UDP-N-acetylmuramoyl-tripeptide--D-alanyl-D-alanine ligase